MARNLYDVILPNYTIRDRAFTAIANILSHYNIPDSRYNISFDIGIILEYISYLESRKENSNENS